MRWPRRRKRSTIRGWRPDSEEERERTGVMIGSGIGGLPGITEGAITIHERGPRRISPYFIPASLINLASGHVSIRYGFKGPNHAVVTACSTGAHAIGDAARLIMLDDADVMVCGGTEAAICRLGIAGFAAARALVDRFQRRPAARLAALGPGTRRFCDGRRAPVSWCSRNTSTPADAMPGSTPRCSATACRATPIHLTAPSEDGSGAFRSMRNALRSARLRPTASTTSMRTAPRPRSATRSSWGRSSACSAITLIGSSMSSTKSAIGHLLGAAGSVEAIFSILALRDGVVPPTLNLENPSPSCDLDLVPKAAQERRVRYVLSNSFGFGGTNASLIFGGAGLGAMSRASAAALPRIGMAR